MPLYCYARVSKTLRDADNGASQPDASQRNKFVNQNIEAIEPISQHNLCAPNASYVGLINILYYCPSDEKEIIFAYVANIRPDPYYGFEIVYNETENEKSKYVVAVISSPNKSKLDTLGAGYKFTTSAVTDYANPNDLTSKTYDVIGYCGMEHVLDFKLEPPRGRQHRVALVLISKAIQNGFHVDKLEHVEPTDEPNAITCFQKCRTLSLGYVQILPTRKT